MKLLAVQEVHHLQRAPRPDRKFHLSRTPVDPLLGSHPPKTAGRTLTMRFLASMTRNTVECEE
jgi:hypothetical protein